MLAVILKASIKSRGVGGKFKSRSMDFNLLLFDEDYFILLYNKMYVAFGLKSLKSVNDLSSCIRNSTPHAPVEIPYSYQRR